MAAAQLMTSGTRTLWWLCVERVGIENHWSCESRQVQRFISALGIWPWRRIYSYGNFEMFILKGLLHLLWHEYIPKFLVWAVMCTNMSTHEYATPTSHTWDCVLQLFSHSNTSQNSCYEQLCAWICHANTRNNHIGYWNNHIYLMQHSVITMVVCYWRHTLNTHTCALSYEDVVLRI